VRTATALAVITAVAVLAVVALGLGDAGVRLAGSNAAKLNAFVAAIPPDRALCQGGEVVPPSAGSLEIYTGTFGHRGPALAVTVGGRLAGTLPSGYAQGWRRIQLSRPARDRRQPSIGVRICFHNAGPRRVALGGQVGALDAFQTVARVGGKPTAGRVTMLWFSARRASWWSQAATVTRRVTFAKADLGPWAPAILLVLVWVGASVVAVRSVRA